MSTETVVQTAAADVSQSTAVGAVDLFAGAGGMALGLRQAGLEVGFGSDIWGPAAETYQANFPDHPFHAGDVRDLTPADLGKRVERAGQPWVFAGGPPCQGFSSAGRRREGDHRNTLVGVYSTLAAEALPDVVIFENVEGFLTAEGGRYVFDLLDPLIEAGYRVALHKVNVANFGIPQLRKRVIGIAALGRNPVMPEPSHSAFGAPGVHKVAPWLPRTLTVMEALEGLPAPGSDEPDLPTLHTKRELKEDDYARVEALKPGQTMRDLPRELWHPSYARRANRRVADGMPTEKRGGAPAGLRRLIGDEPSKAITGAATREFVHPTEHRYLTLRECARLQTFPDDFQFVGTRAEIATLIGNAVPPEFARQLGMAALATLDRPESDLPGGLVSFFPTVAGAMSPALAAVCEQVENRYLRAELGPANADYERGTLWA